MKNEKWVVLFVLNEYKQIRVFSGDGATEQESEECFTQASAGSDQSVSVLGQFTHRIPSQIHLEQLRPVT